MSALTLICALCIAFALGWYFEKSLLATAPLVLCAIGLALYVLAYFRALAWIDGLLCLGGTAAVGAICLRTRRAGRAGLLGELRRQLLDPHLWAAAAILLVMCLLLRGERLLEWDAYNFWGPDVKSLYYQNGFAPKYSNTAPSFGDYTPMPQLIWWWFLHLAGRYEEQYIFWGYFIFGSLLLFAVADRFRAGRGWRRLPAALLSCLCAVILPGVACTGWFRSVYVDPLMAMAFGLILSLVVCRDEAHPRFWQGQLLVYLLCLTLLKSIGVLWAALALLFALLWWGREGLSRPFAALAAGGILLCYGSWAVFCRVMERSTGLVTSFPAALSQRVSELLSGTFFTSGNTLGYIKSYAKAFLFTPIHRESTFALDLSPAALLLVLFAGALLLWKFGFVPQRKCRRLLLFMGGALLAIYTVLGVGQLTMFYGETQYLNPVSAVTLMTRYCSPAHMGLLILLVTLASGQAAGSAPALPAGRQAAAAALAGALILSAGAYAEMGRRFIYDPLDETRLEKRAAYCQQYAPFLRAIEAVPYEQAGSRVLLCVYGESTNPIVINEAAPVSMEFFTFTGQAQQDLIRLEAALAACHGGYLYVSSCPEGLAELLSPHVEGGGFAVGRLYRVNRTEGPELSPVP